MSAHVGLHNEALLLQLLAQLAQLCDGIDARVVSLLPLQSAHLHYEHLGATDLHGIDYVRNLHKDRLNQDICVKLTTRSRMYMSSTSEIANPPEYASVRGNGNRDPIIFLSIAIWKTTSVKPPNRKNVMT